MIISIYKIIASIISSTRGELRYGEVLLAPKPSSLSRTLKYLGSRVVLGCFDRMSVSLLFFLFMFYPAISYSAICFLPDCQVEEKDMRFEPLEEKSCKSMGYAAYPDVHCPQYSLIDECPSNDYYIKCNQQRWCTENGYTITSCPVPKYLDIQCPNLLAYYKKCTCPSSYKYSCTGTGYASGKNLVCEGKYTECNCSTNYVWTGSACVCESGFKYTCSGTGYASGYGAVCEGRYKSCNCSTNYVWGSGVCACDSSFKYTCSGTGYSSGSGASCEGKYKICNCANLYTWTGSACVHYHSYSCPSGYKETSAGMITPVSAAKSCACGATNGTCYKETHVHSYACPSGYITSCSNGYSGTTAKICSCSATNGTCYKCCPTSYQYVCSGTGYSGGSGTSCNNKYTSCTCDTANGYVWGNGVCACASSFKYTCSGTGYASGSGISCGGKYESCKCANLYDWTGSACVHTHSYTCPSGYSASSSGMVTPASTSKVCSCGATSGTCYKETHTHSYSCPSGYSESKSGMITPASTAKVCACGATSGTCYKETHTHSYSCPSGYSASSSGMITPASTSKVCSCGATSGVCYKETHTHSYACPSGYQASSSGMVTPVPTSKVCSCGATSGTCYKEGHTHSYSCPSGYSAFCSNGYSGTATKSCSCGATSGSCYACCASTYQYTCSGTGYNGGSGIACNNKYTECSCDTASGYIWNGSACVCDTSCVVGAIYYSDGTCANPNCYDSSKIAIGIVVKDNALVISKQSSSEMVWSSNEIDINEINYDSVESAETDYNGKFNTATILAKDSGAVAAKYCNDYTTVGTSAGNWYLPAAGEGDEYFYSKIRRISNSEKMIGWTYSKFYTTTWSSTQCDESNAWLTYVAYTSKSKSYAVRCFLPID